MPESPPIFLSAGEASGDHYGAEILAAILARQPHAHVFGLGGPAMETAGLDRIVRAEAVAVMGITEILRHVPRILKAYRSLLIAIELRRPVVAVLIDFPDVNFRLARRLKRLGVPVVWFVSPQLWAWKRRRLRWVQERVDRMLVLFPFEARFYRARGIHAEFVGHPFAAPQLGPLINRDLPVGSSDRVTIALLPGSRAREIEANLPEMVRAAGLLGASYRFVLPVASTIDRSQLAAQLAGLLARQGGSAPSIELTTDARQSLLEAHASVVASGTATVLAAVVGRPFVVVYRVSPLTFALAKRLVSYPSEILAEPDSDGVLPVAMVNLLAGRRLVPELINQRFTAESLAQALTPLLIESPARQLQIEGLAAIRLSLWPFPPGGVHGIERIAEVVLEVLEEHRALHVRSAARHV